MYLFVLSFIKSAHRAQLKAENEKNTDTAHKACILMCFSCSQPPPNGSNPNI